MITTNDILNFAVTHKVFTRKELIAYLKNQTKVDSLRSLSERLDRLLKSKQLIRIERGVYGLPPSSQKTFIAFVSEELKQLVQKIKIQFPFVNYCVWSSKAIVSFMHHIPNLNFIYVDVERDVAESVFEFLNDNSSKRVYLCPDQDNFNRYIIGTEAIIVRTLVSEAPMQVIDGINTPSIEKILVDVAGDVEFDFMQGAEITYFYRNVAERHNINKSKLMRYATRRGRRQEVEQLFNNAL
ncbi:MAG: type IV toxin-antitoxin system AbiEi family antitoxin domain-containing protein [Bacteroidota bacterium]|nr:type IV toxin-antitoxin system AbiEi family antitoxin domain-containing protein [Bacteroidota bacterium]